MKQQFLELLNQYKQNIQVTKNSQETYKWLAVKHFQMYWQPEAEDYSKMFEKAFAKRANLVYQNSYGFLSKLGKHYPDDLKRIMDNLYNESVPLQERLEAHKTESALLLPKLKTAMQKSNFNHQQDERTVAFLLTMRYPEKYYLYKNSIYKSWTKLLDVKPAKAGKKLAHFMQLLDELHEVVTNDYPLQEEITEYVGDNGFEGSYVNMIIQDALFQELYESKEPNYWVFQGNPNMFDFETALKNNVISDWTVTAHKDKIRPGDQVILWITGPNAGVYALAEVTTFPQEKAPQKDDALWKKTDTAELKAGLKITHNLIDTPIFISEVKSVEALKKIKVGSQGTNFSATHDEYKAVLELVNADGKFQATKAKFETHVFDAYITLLRRLNEELDLKPNDPRIVYSIRGSRLNFIIGQRYCINIFGSDTRGKFGVISTTKLTANSRPYEGVPPQPFYTFYDLFEPTAEEWDNVLTAIKSELERTRKSGFKKHNDEEFENYVFDLSAASKTIISNMTPPTNKILYGPPGTGKTYYLKNNLFDKYSQYKTKGSVEDLTLAFCEELGWWEVLAIALTDLGKADIQQLSEHSLVRAKLKIQNPKVPRNALWSRLQDHTVLDCENVKGVRRTIPHLFYKESNSVWRLAKQVEVSDFWEDFEVKYKEFKELARNGKALNIKRYVFTTFHQSYAYEDFIEGIKPVISEEGEASDLAYHIEPGIFKKLCEDAKNDPENRYAIFIDEINRGNVSSIFGELITLIEHDKRAGAANAMSATLPYSKQPFSVPSNVDIYGTMNTADRSVEALDTALRRRFTFEEMMPNTAVLADKQIEDVNLGQLLEVINKRVEALVDRDHTIGHSYFIHVESPEGLHLAFENKIIPLLQEYFYGDYGKIGLVLGKGFVRKTATRPSGEALFAKFDYDNQHEFVQSNFELVPMHTDFDIMQAVGQLLNNTASPSE